jgi:hypothetical protein
MVHFVLKIFPFFLLLLSTLFGFEFHGKPKIERPDQLFFDSIQQDTCVLNGMKFEQMNNAGRTGLKAFIKDGRIKIIDPANQNFKFRVIRYVFSIRRDEKYALVRSYGDLVSFDVFDLLKEGEPGDIYYFEDIIIVSPSKEILDNVLKPIVIKKL